MRFTSTLAVSATLAFGGALIVTRQIRDWASRRRIVALPSNRSLHDRPIPRAGGVAIAVPVLAALVLTLPGPAAAAWAIVAGGAAISALGFADDVWGLGAMPRLAVQAIVACAVTSVVRPALWDAAFQPFDFRFALGFGVASLWIVTLINVVNFMDGIDGLAGAQAAIAGAAWFAAGALVDSPLAMVAGTVLAAASVGFLVFNWAPASIFMGDTGSTFIGFVLAVLPLASSHNQAILLFGPIVMLPFLMDAAVTLCQRALRGENVLQAHRSHVYQRLVLLGRTHGWVARLYIAHAVIAAAVGLVIVRGSSLLWLTVLLVTPASFVLELRRARRRA